MKRSPCGCEGKRWFRRTKYGYACRECFYTKKYSYEILIWARNAVLLATSQEDVAKMWIN